MQSWKDLLSVVKSGAPLQDEIYEFVRKKIFDREFTPAEQLPTEKDLAELYGVSRLTVHRALQRLAQQGLIHRYPGKGSFVSVRATDSEKIGRTHADHNTSYPMIAFILPGAAEAYGMSLLKAAIHRAEQSDYSVIVSFTNDSQAAEEASIRRAVQYGAKGLLVNPVYGEYYSEQLLRLHLDNFPLVLVDKRLDKIPVPYVSTDNYTAAYELTKHLVELGHKYIGFVSPGVAATSTLEDRFAGYLAALEDHDIAYDQRFNLSTLPTGGGVDKPDGPEVYRTIQDYLLEHRELTAILGTEHVFAQIIEDICRNFHLSIPDELSVVCFDSPKLLQNKKLTHIEQQQLEIGEAAVDMLLQLIRDESNSATSIELPGSVVIGQSSSTPRSSDLNLSAKTVV